MDAEEDGCGLHGRGGSSNSTSTRSSVVVAGHM